MERKPLVVGGLVAAVVGIAGWFGYRAYKARAPSSAPAGDALPTFDPSFDPMASPPLRVYVVAVYTSQPIDEAQTPETPFKVRASDYLASLPVTRIAVEGPASDSDLLPMAAGFSPTPDVVLFVTLDGTIFETMPKSQLDDLTNKRGG
jgi:hypothetical protein